jgi:ribose/xylose/arabinose/galactoside ABC-type transport system permease subunit
MSTWGGRGSMLGAVVGALVLAFIANASNFMNFKPEVQYYLQGALLIGSIAAYSLARSRGSARDETTGER